MIKEWYTRRKHNGAVEGRRLADKDAPLTQEITLATLKSGDFATILRMEGDEQFRSKMLHLGIVPGKTVYVASSGNGQHTPSVIRVDESRIMIDWDSLKKIDIQPRWQQKGEISMGERLKDLRVGEVGEVIGYESSDPVYRNKLLAMGLTKGVEVKLVKVAPLGDPVEVIVRDYHLSLRKAEADVLRIRRKA